MLQDCRGRYAWEGSFTKYLNEAEDGEDTLAWLLTQSWCDGRVGTLGLSYGAHVQAALACLAPPGLAAMFLGSGGFSSNYHGGGRQGGAFELKQLTWARKHSLLAPETAADPARRAALQAEDIRDWIGQRWRAGRSPITAAPEYESYIIEQWDNDRFSPFWQQRGIYARLVRRVRGCADGAYVLFPEGDYAFAVSALSYPTRLAAAFLDYVRDHFRELT